MLEKHSLTTVDGDDPPALPSGVSESDDDVDDVEGYSDDNKAEMQRLALLAARINRMRALILDSGSEIHLTPNSKLPGLLDVVQVTEASITGVGDKVKVDKIEVN
jgi:hypothetical protein